MKSNFFRLNYLTPASLDGLIASKGLAGLAPELGMMLRPGHVVLAARFDPFSGKGTVRAIGQVVANASQLVIEWRRTEFDLYPSPQGQLQWKRDHFCFDRSVAERYGLLTHASRAFTDLPVSASGDGCAVLPSEGSDPGYIYVIKSQYGFKIGKSRQLHQRTRLFGVKLPFPIEVALTGWCSEYSETERALHREFAGKRLEGEWFDLSELDLASLRQRFAQAQPPR